MRSFINQLGIFELVGYLFSGIFVSIILIMSFSISIVTLNTIDVFKKYFMLFSMWDKDVISFFEFFEQDFPYILPLVLLVFCYLIGILSSNYSTKYYPINGTSETNYFTSTFDSIHNFLLSLKGLDYTTPDYSPFNDTNQSRLWGIVSEDNLEKSNSYLFYDIKTLIDKRQDQNKLPDQNEKITNDCIDVYYDSIGFSTVLASTLNRIASRVRFTSAIVCASNYSFLFNVIVLLVVFILSIIITIGKYIPMITITICLPDWNINIVNCLPSLIYIIVLLILRYFCHKNAQIDANRYYKYLAISYILYSDNLKLKIQEVSSQKSEVGNNN